MAVPGTDLAGRVIRRNMRLAMAFSPFRTFRKHQKAFFAALTILCMVTFVMCGSMGQGDFFDTIVRMFGGRRKAEVVATLYGKDISFKEINELRNQRRLASQYVDNVTLAARNRFIQEIRETSNKWDDRSKQIVHGLNR